MENCLPDFLLHGFNLRRKSCIKLATAATFSSIDQHSSFSLLRREVYVCRFLLSKPSVADKGKLQIGTGHRSGGYTRRLDGLPSSTEYLIEIILISCSLTYQISSLAQLRIIPLQELSAFHHSKPRVNTSSQILLHIDSMFVKLWDIELVRDSRVSIL